VAEVIAAGDGRWFAPGPACAGAVTADFLTELGNDRPAYLVVEAEAPDAVVAASPETRVVEHDGDQPLLAELLRLDLASRLTGDQAERVAAIADAGAERIANQAAFVRAAITEQGRLLTELEQRGVLDALRSARDGSR
jgi:hypothetical protein